jgi:hypothetical protein
VDGEVGELFLNAPTFFFDAPFAGAPFPEQ